MSNLDGTFLKLLTHIEKVDLLILDDYALQPMNDNVRQALLQILEDRYDRRSVVIISQLSVMKWYDYIAEPTFADAIMDRLVNNARNIELKSESMRKIRNKKLSLQTERTQLNWSTFTEAKGVSLLPLHANE